MAEAHGLDGFSIFGLIVFALAVLCVVRPVLIPLPLKFCQWLWQLAVRLRLAEGILERKLHLHFDLVTAPLLGVLLLLITTSIDGSVIRAGIVGKDGGHPYDVLILFFSLAYIATALDATGALRYLAFTVSQKGGSNGAFLYAMLYTFFFSAAIIIGNDPIVLSGTAFLAYFTRVTGIVPPTAWIYAEFVTANIASAVLVSSNPTNILIAGAFDLNYLTGYTKYTIVPTLVTAVLGFPLLFGMFRIMKPSAETHSSSPPATPIQERPADKENDKRSYIPKRIYPPDVEPRSALIDPQGAVFHVTLLLVTLVVLVGTSFVQTHPPGVWSITMPAGVIALLRDLTTDFLREPNQTPKDQAAAPKEQSEGTPVAAAAEDTSKLAQDPSYPPQSLGSPRRPEKATLPSIWRKFGGRFPSSAHTLSHLPYPLLPFAVGMFILVSSLDYLGWVAVWARWLAIAAPTPASAAFIVGPLTAFVLCVIAGTNIGATVLMVAVIRHPSYAGVVSPQTLNAAIFALAMGSNLGAFGWALSASLAGLLWARILRQKGVIIRQVEFAAWNAVPLVVLTMVASAIVYWEVHWF